VRWNIIGAKMNFTELSKEISYALRHAPWEYELEMDVEGFVSIEHLLLALNESSHYDRQIVQADLEHIIAVSDKKRHEIVGNSIRALYGHSVPMHIEKVPAFAPSVLYHGTTQRAIESIMKEGLKPMARQFVHLSVDEQTAEQVGKRRDSHPIILRVDAYSAQSDGVVFYRGNDKVWLCDALPAKYILKNKH